MIQTLFGNLEFGDESSIKEFLGNHWQVHVDLGQYLANAGIALPVPDLSGPWDDKWFLDHYLLHEALDRALTVPAHPGLYGPRRKVLKEPGAFYDWHRINNDAHLAYSSKTGVV